MERRRLIRAIALVPLPLAGCLDGVGSPDSDSPDGNASSNRTRTTPGETTREERNPDETATEETTSATTETAPVEVVGLSELPEFPAGPKERPDPPDAWDESSAKDYAKRYEERRLYNDHYRPVVEEITMGCTTPNAERIEDGYEVTLRCQGAVYEEDSKTHGDYIGPRIVYRLRSDSVVREVVDS